MIFKKMICRISFLAVLACANTGCMRFTERDYELQKKAYEKQHQQEEAEKQDRLNIRW
ncbi:MAG TPA: hypothetical protein PL155_00970 [Candidatus Omnitrophota bacterium]|nr:hypothetical protein [Candidatus Omnitrophota bacterium]HPD84943.1 hypothetical protein [Candidatus Omnitrophota bacterium]HRZ03801.1 hypothetical protein [Candidatus Omnitrophota bacterium]